MSLRNVPVIGKVLVVIGVFAIFSVASVVIMSAKLSHIAEGYQASIQHEGVTALTMARANRAMNGAHAAIGDLTAASTADGNAKALAFLAAQRAAFVKYIDMADAANLDATIDLKALKTSGLNIIDQSCQPAIDLAKAATAPSEVLAAAAKFETTCAPAFAPHVVAMTTSVDEAVSRQDKISADLAAAAASSIVLISIAMFVAIAVVVIGSIFAIRSWVSRPIKTLTETMNRLAGGDLSVPVIGAEYRDEVALMARSVQVFKDSALKLKASETEAERMRATSDRERQTSDAARATAAGQQELVVRAIADGLGQLSNGDLTFRIEQSFTNDYETLRVDFNAAMAKLQDTMAVVSANTSAIRSGTDEISTGADDLSKRTEQQAASLEETAAALDEITATVRKTAEGSRHARQVVGSAKQDAEHSGVVVRQAVEAMNGIEKSSEQISQIIGVIDEIAFQTNLLALNAGVEAARAGEAGRGFAVVASEVRALAQRSADAAKEIKALISASGVQVAQGVDLVAETGKALERIVIQVAEINGIVGEIAASAQEQATGLDQVNTAVNQMDQVTQQNAAMVEQSTAASHALAQETDQLATLIASFKLGASAQGRSTPRAVPARSKTTATATGMKTVGRGGAARKPEPASDDWQEF